MCRHGKNHNCGCRNSNKFRERQQNSVVAPNPIVVGSETLEQRSRMLDTARAKQNMQSRVAPKSKRAKLKTATKSIQQQSPALVQQPFKTSVQVEDPAKTMKLVQPAHNSAGGGYGGVVVGLLALGGLIWAVSRSSESKRIVK